MRSREESCFRGIHPSPPVPSEKRVPFWCGERGGRTGAPRRPPCSETMVPCENGSSQATGACRGGGRGVRRPGGGPRAGAASSVCPAFASAPQEDDPQSPVPTAPPHWWKANSSLRRIGSISLTRWLEACAEATSVHPRGRGGQRSGRAVAGSHRRGRRGSSSRPGNQGDITGIFSRFPPPI